MTTKTMRVTVDGKSYDVVVEILDEGTGTPAPAPAPTTSAAPVVAPTKAAAPAPAPAPAAAGGGSVTSPLAGKITEVHVAQGDQVEAGAKLLTLEAMKMFTDITAPSAGTVTQLNASKDAAVAEGDVLVVIG